MRISGTLAVVFVVTFIAGVIIGAAATARMARREETEMVHSLILSHAALETTRLTMLLKAIGEGKQDCAADRMEMILSSAVRDIGREYSATRDQYGSAAKALALANEYRTAYPRKESLASWTQETQAALATKTTPVKP